jgi:polyisoprenoid-binding protein YceI
LAPTIGAEKVMTMSLSLVSKFRRVAAPLACAVLLAACDGKLAPASVDTEVVAMKAGQYTLDKDHATLLFKVNHLGFSTFIGRFNALDASLDFDPEKIENTKLEVVVDMKSIDVNNPKFAEDLRGSDWLDVAKYPQAVFKTTKLVESTDKNSFKFEGDLTFHGVTAPVILDVKFHGGGRNFLTRKFTLGFSASAKFKRSAFGADNMVSFGVGDDVELEIHVEFQKAGSDRPRSRQTESAPTEAAPQS